MTVLSTARQAEALAAVRQALRLGTAFFFISCRHCRTALRDVHYCGVCRANRVKTVNCRANFRVNCRVNRLNRVKCTVDSADSTQSQQSLSTLQLAELASALLGLRLNSALADSFQSQQRLSAVQLPELASAL